MNRVVSHTYYTLLTLLLLLPTGASGVTPLVLGFDASHDTLSAEIDNRPLSEVLQQLFVQTGIKSEIMPAADRNISLHFDPMPLERALKQLLRGTNHAYVYQKKDGGYAISGIRVLASGEEGNLVATTEPKVPVRVGEQSAKEDSPEYQRQQKIEQIKLKKLRRERNLPPVGLGQQKVPARERLAKRNAPSHD